MEMATEDDTKAVAQNGENGHKPEGLWTVRECACYLARSERWVWDALAADPDKTGSIPHVRIPGGRGCRSHGGSPRFIPADIRAWVTDGCPPATVFKSWQEADEKRRSRA
jgi:hypothetical protein